MKTHNKIFWLAMVGALIFTCLDIIIRSLGNQLFIELFCLACFGMFISGMLLGWINSNK